MKVSGTGITVIPMLPKCQVPESLPYRTEHPEVVGTGVDIVPNLHECPGAVLMLHRSYR